LKAKEDSIGLEQLELPKQKKYEVLVVDDFPENLIFVGEYLKQNNIDVKFATNGRLALDICNNDIPDLILLDIAMPTMDGFETCKKLKANSETQNIPVIFLTAKVEVEDIVKGFDVGGVDYITKPFNLLELTSRIKSHLSLKNKHDKLQLMNSRLVEAVKMRSEKLRLANEDLSNLDKAKNDFLIHINHQLRTPLNGILGYSELLAHTKINNEQKEFVNEIKNLVDRLVKLSERSLLFTELRADTYKLNMQIHSANEMILESLAVVKLRYEDKNVNIDNRLSSVDFQILGDDNLLHRCFNIVLDNAIKYSPENGNIIIESQEFENGSKIIITDEGSGIPDEYRSQKLDIFNTYNQEEAGFGLGLATAKLIMSTLAGKIELKNKEEGGAEVRLYFYDQSL
jgi:two-component system sensor histidine kinase/response regulator